MAGIVGSLKFLSKIKRNQIRLVHIFLAMWSCMIYAISCCLYDPISHAHAPTRIGKHFKNIQHGCSRWAPQPHLTPCSDFAWGMLKDMRFKTLGEKDQTHEQGVMNRNTQTRGGGNRNAPTRMNRTGGAKWSTQNRILIWTDRWTDGRTVIKKGL